MRMLSTRSPTRFYTCFWPSLSPAIISFSPQAHGLLVCLDLRVGTTQSERHGLQFDYYVDVYLATVQCTRESSCLRACRAQSQLSDAPYSCLTLETLLPTSLKVVIPYI